MIRIRCFWLVLAEKAVHLSDGLDGTCSVQGLILHNPLLYVQQREEESYMPPFTVLTTGMQQDCELGKTQSSLTNDGIYLKR